MVKLIAMKGMLISPISNDVSHHNNQFCFIVSPQILLIKKKIGFLQILLWDFRFGLNCTPCFSFFFNLKYDKHLVVAFHILELLICNILGLEKFPGFACLQI